MFFGFDSIPNQDKTQEMCNSIISNTVVLCVTVLLKMLYTKMI